MSSDYHGRIMNLQHKPDYTVDRYSCGHRDARHAAAEIALEAQAEVERLRAQVAELDALICDLMWCDHWRHPHCARLRRGWRGNRRKRRRRDDRN